MNQNTENIGKGQFHLIGHAHTDLAWLWPVSETMHEVCPLTFRSVLNLMEQYPDFVFAQSSAQIYKWMELFYPDLFEEIQEKVKEGRWEVIGGSWVEHTSNIVGGESLVRQHLYGKRYFKDKFDIDVKTAWLPDSFGFNWNLPQIYNKCGINALYTHKLKWQIERNDPAIPFPHHLFWWQGVDGSQILTYHDYAAYNERVLPGDLVRYLKNLKKDTGLDKLLVVFGEGDHGGGPMPDMLRRADRLAKSSEFPEIKYVKATDYFSEIMPLPETKKLPVYNEELYLKTHRGTLTTDSQVKRDNRLCETLLLNIEKIAFVAQQIGCSYPDETLHDLWERYLYTQVHDNLDGASVAPVYNDAATEYGTLKVDGKKLLDASLKTLFASVDTDGEGEALVVFNSQPWGRSGIVELPQKDVAKFGTFQIIDHNGDVISHQTIMDQNRKKIIFNIENIPAMGYRVFRLISVDVPAESSSDLNVNGFELSNSFITVTVDKNTGNICSLKKKGVDVDYFRTDAQGNALDIWMDEPKDPVNGESAWNINLIEKEDPAVLTDISVVETGPVKAVIRVKKEWNNSSFEQDIILYAHAERVDFEFRADWAEKHKIAKVSFPFQVKSSFAAYEIPFGYIERYDFGIKSDPGVELNTPKRAWEEADQTKYEVAALRWVNVSDKNNLCGITLLNDSKYGFSQENGTLRMSLLRGPRRGGQGMPDVYADQSSHPIVGIHKVKYAIVPHNGAWRDTNTARQGVEFNTPFLSKIEASHSGKDSHAIRSIKVEPDNVIVETIKKSEDSEEFVIRLYEAHGYDTEAVISFSHTPQSVQETDMLEWDKYAPTDSFPVIRNDVKITLKKHEVKTIRVRLGT